MSGYVEPQPGEEPWLPESQAQEHADLLADRATLAQVSDDLVNLSVAARTLVASVPRRALAARGRYVRVPRRYVEDLRDAIDRRGNP